MNHPTYLKDVVTLKLDETKCTGCGMCLEVCPHAVFQMNARLVKIRDRDACMECGACSRNCPVGAVSVKAGVGCATAVIGSMLDQSGQPSCGPANCGCSAPASKKTACCG